MWGRIVPFKGSERDRLLLSPPRRGPGRGPATKAGNEEIGTRKGEVLAETAGWLTYDLPEHLVGKALKGRYRGQKQKWFAMRFTGDDGDIDIAGVEHPEFDAWAWMTAATMLERIIDFKRDIYRRVFEEFRTHLL